MNGLAHATALLVLLGACSAPPSPPPSPSSVTAGAEARDENAGPNTLEPRSLLGEPAPRTGVRTRFELDSMAALRRAGWVAAPGDGGSTEAGGVLRIRRHSWSQRPDGPPSRWWARVTAARGWAVEARVRVRRARDHAFVGLWIHDGSRSVSLELREDSVGMLDVRHAMDTTGAFHTYRVEGKDDWVRVAVDGVVVLELRGDRVSGDRMEQALVFGGIGRSLAEWDWVGYDTAPRVLVPVPCPYCRSGESARVGQLRARLVDLAPGVASIDAPATEGADPACLLYGAIDRIARDLGPAWVEPSDPVAAAELRQLPAIHDAPSARAYDALFERWSERLARGFPAGPPSHRLNRRPPMPPQWAHTLLAVVRAPRERATERAWWLLAELLRYRLRARREGAEELFRGIATDLAPRCVPTGDDVEM